MSNPRVRRHVEVDGRAAQALVDAPASATEEEWSRLLSSGRGRRRTTFTNGAGLLADPTGCGPAEGPMLEGEALFRALRETWALCAEDGRDYQAFLGPRSSVLDEGHLGTFHQVLGRHLLIDKRVRETWRWWHDQKFSPDGRELRPGLYRWIQGHFFDQYFGAQDLAGKTLLDFACGNGYYAAKFRARGARVTAVDTSPELIAIARQNHGDGVDFHQPVDEKACEAFLASLSDASFDRIYLSDALLFFFHDLKTGRGPSDALQRLLAELRRLLKRDGVFYLMEPNGTFWLSGWLGAPPRPLSVVTEYREHIYHVAPTVDRVISALGEAGFVIASLVHPTVSPEAEQADPMMFGFARAFPLWDFYVCLPR